MGQFNPEDFPMLESAPFAFRVVTPVLSPIAARERQVVVVWPGHPTHTLTVTDEAGVRVVRHRHVPDGALYGQLLILDADGALECLTPQTWPHARRHAS